VVLAIHECQRSVYGSNARAAGEPRGVPAE
jgi:hypothetical protein